MRAAKAIVGALIAAVTAFGVAKADGHPWPTAIGLGVTAAIVSFAGVYQVPNAPKP